MFKKMDKRYVPVEVRWKIIRGILILKKIH